ncbi:HAD hydrolase, family IIA protein [Toxoplasma gondii FOU]|uniref:HAD hydrolase, family IIA protein n=1 Tax=Toxoplasma gondii FOU TaxID=943167 RepID=A0A086KZK7_TOXGO|nr:HAD hydrolase, family IIA protein [Toxoplasma gondii FOU]
MAERERGRNEKEGETREKKSERKGEEEKEGDTQERADRARERERKVEQSWVSRSSQDPLSRPPFPFFLIFLSRGGGKVSFWERGNFFESTSEKEDALLILPQTQDKGRETPFQTKARLPIFPLFHFRSVQSVAPLLSSSHTFSSPRASARERPEQTSTDLLGATQRTRFRGEVGRKQHRKSPLFQQTTNLTSRLQTNLRLASF